MFVFWLPCGAMYKVEVDAVKDAVKWVFLVMVALFVGVAQLAGAEEVQVVDESSNVAGSAYWSEGDGAVGVARFVVQDDTGAYVDGFEDQVAAIEYAQTNGASEGSPNPLTEHFVAPFKVIDTGQAGRPVVASELVPKGVEVHPLSLEEKVARNYALTGKELSEATAARAVVPPLDG